MLTNNYGLNDKRLYKPYLKLTNRFEADGDKEAFLAYWIRSLSVVVPVAAQPLRSDTVQPSLPTRVYVTHNAYLSSDSVFTQLTDCTTDCELL